MTGAAATLALPRDRGVDVGGFDAVLSWAQE